MMSLIKAALVIICVSISALALYCDFSFKEFIEDSIDAVKGQHIYIYVCDGKRYKKRTVRIKNEEIAGLLYRKLEKPLTKLKNEAKDRKQPCHEELEQLFISFYPEFELLYTDLKSWADRYNHADESEQNALEQVLDSKMEVIVQPIVQLRIKRASIKNSYDRYVADCDQAERELVRREISEDKWFRNISLMSENNKELEKLRQKYDKH